MPAQIRILDHVFGLGTRAEHTIGKPRQGTSMAFERLDFVAGRQIRSCGFGQIAQYRTRLAADGQHACKPGRGRAHISMSDISATAVMAKASETRPRLPKRRITSSRKSSASGAWWRAGFGEANRQSATSNGMAVKSRATTARRIAGSTPPRCAISITSWVQGPQSSAMIATMRGCTIGGGRHVFAISAETGHFAEGEQRARVGIEHLAQIACIVVPGALELSDPAAAKTI